MRVLIRMFSGIIAIYIFLIKRRTRNIIFIFNLTNQLRNDVIMKIIIINYNKKISKC